MFEIAHLTPEQVSLFKSDFRIVADYFVQMAQNEAYVPPQEQIRHVEELLKLLSALTGDSRFEDAYNAEHRQKGALVTMRDVFSEYENRGLERSREEGMEKGTLLTLYRLVKRGLLSPAAAVEDAGMDERDFIAQMAQVYSN